MNGGGRAGVMAILLVAPLALVSGGRAATLSGRGLSIERFCARDGETISVMPDQTLSDTVVVDGSPASTRNDGGQIRIGGACGEEEGDIAVRVPPSLPISAHVEGRATLALGDLAGPIDVQLIGNARLVAGTLSGPVQLLSTGGGGVRADAFDGPTKVTLAGSGDLSVGQVQTPALALTVSGSGDARIGDGTIGALHATLAGSGDLAIAGTVGGGDVVVAGSGDVRIARVTGTLSRMRTGSGDIDVRSDRSGAGSSHTIRIPGLPGSAITIPLPLPLHARPEGGAGGGRGGAGFLTPAVLLLGGGAVLVGLLRRRGGRSAAGVTNGSVDALAERMERVARRIARIEALVTSHEFETHRRFRDIGD